MIDRTKINFYYDTEAEMNNVLNNPMFVNPELRQSKTTGEPIHIYNLKDLQVKFFLLSKFVTIDGSLITFRHSEHPCKNVHCMDYCTNLTYSDIHFVSDYISAIFHREKRDLRISYLEFELTVKTPETPLFYIDGFNSIKSKSFYSLPPPRNQCKPLEKYCPFTQYTVKGYDYGAWNNISANYMRYEIVFRKMQKVRQVTHRNKITLSDLTDKRFLNDMATFALNTYRNTDKQLSVDCRRLKPREIELFFAGQHPRFWEELRKFHPHSQRKLRAEYRRLYKRLAESGNHHYNELEGLLQSKYEHLISN